MARENIWKCNVLAVDKFKNISSAKMVDRVKGVIFQNFGEPHWLKIGHGGTLDETATGVLVIGTGLACKMLPQLLSSSKKYFVRAKLGIETDTYNETGAVIDEKSYEHVSKTILSSTLKNFVGNIMQVPPKYSAIKIGGIRAADLTRDGIKVCLIPRRVRCYSLKLVSFDPPYFDMTLNVSGGFYVRSLVHDLGMALNSCAHVVELRRTEQAFLHENVCIDGKSFTYEDLILNTEAIESLSEFKKMQSLLGRGAKNAFKKKTNMWYDPT